jgi:hypothetical protein
MVDGDDGRPRAAVEAGDEVAPLVGLGDVLGTVRVVCWNDAATDSSGARRVESFAAAHYAPTSAFFMSSRSCESRSVVLTGPAFALASPPLIGAPPMMFARGRRAEERWREADDGKAFALDQKGRQ